MIVGAIAPRSLLYAHEFRWDRPRDPVWQRLRTIYGWHDAADRLSFVEGQGTVRGRSPEASHCTNIGSLHRSQIYPALERWFAMTPPKEADFERYTSDDLRCFTDEEEKFDAGVAVQKLYVAQRHEQIARNLRPGYQDRSIIVKQLAVVLGPSDADKQVQPTVISRNEQLPIKLTRLRIDRQGVDTTVPLPLLIYEPQEIKQPPRVVVGISQHGKESFLQHRSEVISQLLHEGAVVVLAELRGTGETEPNDEGRGRSSGATSRSASELMLGRTTVGLRVGDLRTILAHLRTLPQCRGGDFALWGEGFAPANDEGTTIAAPLDAEKLPRSSEPMGDLVAVFTALFERDVRSVVTSGGLSSLARVLDSPYIYLPHDCLVPGLLRVADLPDFREALRSSGRQVMAFDLRDVQNRKADGQPLDSLPTAIAIAQALLSRS